MASLPFNNAPNSNFSHSKPTKSHRINQTHFTKLQLEPNHRRFPYKSYLRNISSLCKQGQIQHALNLLKYMELRNVVIGADIYGELLQGCVYERDFLTGQQIHARIIKNGDLFSRNEYIETKLLIFYAKCGSLEIANSLFVRLRVKNEFSWASITGLHCRLGFHEDALIGLCEMIDSGLLADNFVLPNVLKACGALQWIRFGKGVHCYAVKTGLDGCVFVSSSLVDMYGKCGILKDARKMFDNMPQKNVVTWNSLIMGYVQNGFHQEAIEMFYDMRLEDVEHSRVTLSGFLSASANLGAVAEGMQGHAFAIKGGCELDNILGSSILNFYSKIGLIEDAELVFSRMLEKDVVTWNLLISSYVQCQQVEKALDTCRLMRSENMKFDSVTLASILSACANMKNIELGKEGHSYCIRNSLESDVVVANSIINMYIKCGRTRNARVVFNYTINKDLTMWNTLLTAYAELGLVGETLKLFYKMQLESVPPNVTSWNSVILGFLRNGKVNNAKDMFTEMQAVGVHPNLVTMTTLISGLLHNGLGNEALQIFQRMQEYRIRPNTESIISTISACRDVASLQYGRAIHGYIIRHGLWSRIPIAKALVDMYLKCGYDNQANRVFDMILSKESPKHNTNDLCLSQMHSTIKV
ncbi:hypothetical protein JCGZ_13262 [Jatropha curcas]|uniref:Pentacotripeptide-repeat region of PRORP domain-containing protein n=1 Tax=Jatropha curcas TaxID=180498 RepID=A0A067K8B2_JATCU|nr:hypothetical protein JCGZ_13262 [Jatropha curcas]